MTFWKRLLIEGMNNLLEFWKVIRSRYEYLPVEIFDVNRGKWQ